MKDLRQYKNEPAFLESFDRMFTTYPEMVRDIMNGCSSSTARRSSR